MIEIGDSAHAKPVCRRLVEAGIDATAFGPGEMAGVGEMERAKGLAPALGAPEPLYMVEAWRAEGRGLVCSSVVAIVRGQLRLPRGASFEDEIDRRREVRRAPGMGRVGMTEVLTIEDSGDAGSWSELVEVLDVHLADGSWIRCDGRKFSFDVLGAERGYSDLENMDKLAVRLATEAPRAIVDTGWKGFRAPPGVLERSGIQIGGKPVRRSEPESLFGFYSAWIGQRGRAMLA